MPRLPDPAELARLQEHEQKQLNVRLPASLFRAVGYVAVARDVTMPGLVKEIVTEWLAVHGDEVQMAGLASAAQATEVAAFYSGTGPEGSELVLGPLLREPGDQDF